MAATTWNYAADSDEEFSEEGDKAFSGKTALLVMIDSSPEMFEPWGENNDVPFRAAIKCCQAIWRSKVVSNEKDLVSILLVSTEQSKNSSNFENLYQLQDLSSVKVAMIEELNAMKNSEDFDGFESRIGTSGTFDLKNAFWLAKIIFEEGKATTYQKQVLYFTRNDNPHRGKPNMQKEVIKKFKDMGKVEFKIVAFDDDFNLENFYSEILGDASCLIKADKLESLMKVVRIKQRLRRPLSRSTLEIAPGLKIGIGFYSFVRPAKTPRAVNINKRTNEVLEKRTSEFRNDTGMPVLKSEERKMIQVQGKEAIFTKEEIKEIKYVHEPGVSVMGFIKYDDFNHFTWYRSPGYFMYPDEERISGSRDLFVALLKRCHILKKIALVRMVLTRGRSPKLACLIPSLDDSVFPQGFHVFPVPFCDEMRKFDMAEERKPAENLVVLMEKVIKKITNKGFDVLDVQNPMLQYRWRELEQIALDLNQEELDEFHDFTEPNEDLMLQRLDDLLNQVNSVAEYISNSFSNTKSTASIVKVNMAMEAKHKRLDKLTVPILKGFLESKNINAAMKRKSELVDATYQYFEDNGYN